MVRRLCPLVILSLLPGCVTTTKVQESGAYVVANKSDGYGGLFCQPRLEFYFVDHAGSPNTYLGTCGTPAMISKSVHLSGDASWFAIAPDGTSMVYLHRPALCGAGDTAAAKRGGVYLHTNKTGDRLLYDDSQVSQVWSGRELPVPGIRVGWMGTKPHKSGVVQGQDLVISTSGEEFGEKQ